MAQIAHITTPHNSGLGDPLATGFENQNSMNTELYSNKVDKIAGKGLSDTNFSQVEKDKLASLNPLAQPQVQADYNQTDINAVDYIKNKPDSAFEPKILDGFIGVTVGFAVGQQTFPLPAGSKCINVFLSHTKQYKKTANNASLVNLWDQINGDVVLTKSPVLNNYLFIEYI